MIKDSSKTDQTPASSRSLRHRRHALWISAALGGILFTLAWFSPESSFQQTAALQFSGGLFLFFLIELFLPQMAASLFDRNAESREWVYSEVAPSAEGIPPKVMRDCLQSCLKTYGIDPSSRRISSKNADAAIGDDELDDDEKRRAILIIALEQAGRYGVKYVMKASAARLRIERDDSAID